MKHSMVRASVLAACATATGVGVAEAAAPPAQIVIPGERLFTESLTSSKDGSVIVGSLGKQTIFRAKPGAANAEAWIQPGTNGLVSVFGVFADDKSNTLWACSGTPAFGPPQAGAPPPVPSALFAFDLKTGAPKGKYPLPTAGAFCNDIAVGSDGSAYATDASNMQIVRLKKGGTAVEVWTQDGFGPKGGVLDGIAVLGNRVLVNALFTSKLFSVPIGKDGKAGAITEVKLDRAIERPDGMRSFGTKDTLLIVEGGSGGRLSKIVLSGDSGKVTTVKEGYPDGPVAVTVVGKTAYVLEGQLAGMRGPPPGGAAPPAKPFKATSVEVGKP